MNRWACCSGKSTKHELNLFQTSKIKPKFNPKLNLTKMMLKLSRF